MLSITRPTYAYWTIQEAAMLTHIGRKRGKPTEVLHHARRQRGLRHALASIIALRHVHGHPLYRSPNQAIKAGFVLSSTLLYSGSLWDMANKADCDGSRHDVMTSILGIAVALWFGVICTDPATLLDEV